MIVTGVLAAAGGLLAWTTISNDLLEPELEEAPRARPAEYHCAVAGTPLSRRGNATAAAASVPGKADQAV